MKLTQEEKRIRIAESQGWTSRSGVLKYDGEDMPWTVWSKDGKDYNTLPDYFNSLDACHEMEKYFCRGGWYDVSGDYGEYRNRLSYECLKGKAISSTFATAAQRAEAFGLTLGLWKEGE